MVLPVPEAATSTATRPESSAIPQACSITPAPAACRIAAKVTLEARA
ncbi:hypothetical protein [Branchiibius cervicis]|uniref:Uncharacterized protein n=1 Tax=Branchiibius cervicis TaxID=908252 RepID=A0ABW2AP83_9MICO